MQKDGNTRPEDQSHLRQVLSPCTLHHLHQVDTTTAPKREPQPAPTLHPHFKYILNFAVFGLRKSRENTKRPQKFIHFCPVLPCSFENLPRLEQEGDSEQSEQRECPAIWENHRQRTPPPFGERQVPLAPIIFRTKNTEKSRLGLIGKNFGKNLWGNVSGEKESPQSCGKGARC